VTTWRGVAVDGGGGAVTGGRAMGAGMSPLEEV